METNLEENSESYTGMNSDLVETYNTLLDYRQKIQEADAAEIEFDLPEIVVVGGQSNGKSSVLESVVGREFLPKGSGTVTRCPIVIRLVQDQVASEYVWIEPDMSADNRKNFDKSKFRVDGNLTAEITEAQKRVLGDKNVTDERVFVEIRAKNVVNLTLVDLPGLILHDNDDGAFKTEVDNLVQSYISRPHVICLVVSNADTDLQMNVGYHMVEKEGKLESSIFILTKPDMLVSKELHRGQETKFENQNAYMVLNRRGEEDAALSAEEWQTREKEFFTKLQTDQLMYKRFKDRLGVEQLTKKVSNDLLETLKNVAKVNHALLTSKSQEQHEIDRLRELIKSMTDGSLSLVTVLNKCQKEVKESLRASTNTFTFTGKATIEKTAIPAEVKNILSEKLSKFVQVEMQRIVPLLTTDDVLKQSAPHGQEYYQDNSSWTNVAMTAIRETFFTMKNSFVSSSKPSGIQATSSDHLDLISGKIESAVRNILRENLKDFDYEITASDHCHGTLNDICERLAGAMHHEALKNTLKGISDYFDEEIHTISYIENHYSNLQIKETWELEIGKFYENNQANKPPPPSRKRTARVSTTSVKPEKDIPVTDTEDDPKFYPTSLQGARTYAQKYCFWLNAQISDRLRKIINLKFLAEIHNYFDGKFLEETHAELTSLITEAEINEQALLSSSQVKGYQDDLKHHENKLEIFEGLLKEINSLSAKIGRLQDKL